MRKALLISAALVIGAVMAAAMRETFRPQPPKKTVPVARSWQPAPPSLPAGAQVALLNGDPAQAEKRFLMAVRVANHYKVPPHAHPSEETVSVVSGSLLLGIGDEWDDGALRPIQPGGFIRIPAGTHHFMVATRATVFEVIGVGPYETTYRNPNDDPRNEKPSTGSAPNVDGTVPAPIETLAERTFPG